MSEWEEVLPPEKAARPTDDSVGVAAFACASASVVLALLDPVFVVFSVPLAAVAAVCGRAGQRRGPRALRIATSPWRVSCSRWSASA